MNEHILTLARENAPCYLYEYDIMKAQVETLRQTFPQYDLLYSIKANPFPPVVRALAGTGSGRGRRLCPGGAAEPEMRHGEGGHFLLRCREIRTRRWKRRGTRARSSPTRWARWRISVRCAAGKGSGEPSVCG